MSTRLHHLADHGQSVWIDFLSRDLLRSGELARLLREDNVSGVTSNPTIFARALSGGTHTTSRQKLRRGHPKDVRGHPLKIWLE